MAKKSRRSRRTVSRAKSSTANRQKAPAVTPIASKDVRSTTLDVVPTQQAKPQASRKTPDFSKEYHYVISDLNRIGILAAVLIAGLIALSLVL